MQLIKCDTDEVLLKVPSLEKVLTSYFGENDVLLFSCLDNKKISFIARHGKFCVYIDGDREIPFGLKEDGGLDFYYKDDMHYFPNGFQIFDEDEVCCKDKKGILHTIISYPMDFGDEVNGAFSYFQLNDDKDTLCEIRYRHYYNKQSNGKSQIYGCNLNRKMNSIYIDREYSKNKGFRRGIIPKCFSHYEIISFDNNMLGYRFIAISEHGLLNVINNGSLSLVKESTATRYLKSCYIKRDGTPMEMPWPFCKFYKEDDIKSELSELDFRVEAPDDLISLYNGDNVDKLLLDNLILLMNNVIKENDDTKYMLLRKKA